MAKQQEKQIDGAKPVLKWIDTSLLIIPIEYQRGQTRIAKKIQNCFDWNKVQTICVSERPDGKFNVVEGGNRVRAATELKIQKLPCSVLSNLSIPHQARIFQAINGDRVSVSCIDDHRAALCAKDPMATKVEEIAAEVGYKIERASRKDGFAFEAVASLYRAIKLDEKSARSSLHMCSEIAEGERIPRHAFVGIFAVETRFQSQRGKTIATDFFINKLKRQGGIAHIMHDIRKATFESQYNIGGGNSKIFAAGVLLSLNKGLRSGKVKISFE